MSSCSALSLNCAFRFLCPRRERWYADRIDEKVWLVWAAAYWRASSSVSKGVPDVLKDGKSGSGRLSRRHGATGGEGWSAGRRMR